MKLLSWIWSHPIWTLIIVIVVFVAVLLPTSILFGEGSGTGGTSNLVTLPTTTTK